MLSSTTSKPAVNTRSLMAAIILVLASSDAMAYVDPNATSALAQWMMPLTIAVAAGWRWIKTLVLVGIARIKNRF